MSAPWEPCPTVGCPCPNHRLPCYSVGEPDNFSRDPHFCHLTQTNNIPLHAEEVAISSTIADLEANVASVSAAEDKLRASRGAYIAQLEAIDSQLQNLKDERKRLSKAIRQRKGVLSPVRRIPMEILQRIFLDTIQFPVPCSVVEDSEDEREPHQYAFVEEDCMLWTVELVCRTWKIAVLGDPSLWSFIDIVLSDANFNGGNTQYISRLVRQMTRAQTCPLSVSVRCSSFNSDRLPIQLPMLLLPNAYRIYELFLYLPIPLMSGLSPMRKHLQMLTRLSIVNTPFSVHTDPLSIFDECPRLTYIDITDVISTSRVFAFPWAQIQTYISKHAYVFWGPRGLKPSPRPRGLRSILEKATNLQESNITLELSSPNFTPNSLTCHHLVDLTIVLMSEDHELEGHPLLQLLDGLVLPSLEILSIGVREDRDIKVVESNTIFTCVVDVIERSQCPLQYLEYPDGAILAEDLVRIVNRIATLEELALMWVGGDEEPVNLSSFFRTLTSERDGLMVSPVLEILTLSGQFEFGANELLDMLEARSADSPIKQLTLEWEASHRVPQEQVDAEMAAILQGIEKYCNTGLIFSKELE